MDERYIPILRMHPPIPREGEGGGRSEPYILRGRDEEFTRIAAAISNNDATTYVIEGPPGTGKTALADAVGAYAGRCGYTVINMDASTIADAYQVAHQIWTQFDHRGRPEPDNDKSEFEIDLALVQFRRTFNSTEYEASRELVTNLARCYRLQNQGKTGHTRGFVLIFDNAATWRDTVNLPPDNQTHRNLKALCNTLNDVVRKIQPRVPILTIFAGTPGTVRTIQELTSDRLESTQYFLRGIRTSAVQQIIEDHFRLQYSEKEIVLQPNVLSDEAFPLITEACEHNVWHATTIGRELQHLCLENLDHKPSLDEVQHAIDEGQIKVYRDIHQRFIETEREVLAYIVSTANARENRLDIESTKDLLRKANRTLGTEVSMERYLRKGIIEHRERTNRYARRTDSAPGEPHYRVTVPSYATFIQGEVPDKSKTRQRIVHDHLQTMPTVPAWEWHAEDEIQDIPRMPSDYDETDTPGQAHQLYPLIPGDDPAGAH